MNFLFTVALNNQDTAQNYKSILGLFKTLANTLERMGHKTYIICHTKAGAVTDDYNKVYQLDTFDENNADAYLNAIRFKPDYSFIWNGNLPSDQLTIKTLKARGIKIIYGELGFFNHYGKTCYFDLIGVNCRLSNISSELQAKDVEYTESIINKLQEENRKPQIHEKPFIFVPLQVETDTQIVKYSPFKTMDELMQYVSDIYQYDDRDILFKRHPLVPANVGIYDKFIEVKDDVHHYIPYADMVIGINSTVLIETLLYHSNVISLGAGVTSRNLNSDQERKSLIVSLYERQMNWGDLSDTTKVENSIFYQELLRNHK
jgi:hypothetical protein